MPQAKIYLVVFLVLSIFPLNAKETFDPARDTFSFSNETVFAYSEGPQSSEEAYSRRCFVMIRAALQFRRHARFDPNAAKVARENYAALIDQIVARPAWKAGENSSRITIPGYADLQEFSTAHPRSLQEKLGEGLPTYFRPANQRILLPFPPEHQKAVAEKIAAAVANDGVQAIFITRLPALNHALLVHKATRTPDGWDFVYYDPNLPALRQRLILRDGIFYLPKSFYFEGGKAGVFCIYTHPLN